MKSPHTTIITLLLCCSLGAFADESQYFHTSQLFPASVQSPTASDLGKYGDISVSHYTGRANVAIPLFSITQNGIPLNINLTYDTSGMQVNELPGIVGHGWTLNVGGCITRVMNHDYDEMTYRTDLPWASSFKNYFHAHDTLTSVMSKTQAQRIALFEDRYLNYDLSPDIFYFNFMGKTGKFFMGNDGVWRVDSEDNLVVVFNHEKDTSYIYPFISTLPYGGTGGYENHNQPRTIKGFTLIDDNGIQYVFGDHDGDCGTSAIEYSTDLSSCSDYEEMEAWHATAWYLTKVKDRFGNMVYKFIYHRGEYIAQVYNAFAGAATQYPNNNLLIIDNVDFPYSMTLVSPVYLSTVITKDKLHFNFEYKNAVDYPALRGDSLYPNLFPMLNRDNPLLARKIIHTYNHTQSEEYNQYPFYYLQYPLDSIAQFRVTSDNTIQNPLSATGLRLLDKIYCDSRRSLSAEFFDPNDLRIGNLRSSNPHFNFSYSFDGRPHLTEVSQNEEKTYRFIYNDFQLLPRDYLTKQTDHWGYYNGIEYTLPTNSNVYSFSGREPNTTTSQYGTLSEIVYPTGGCTKITYEQNYYSSYLSDNSIQMCMGSGYAGGLRVSKIEDFENTNHTKILSSTQYHYRKANGSSSGTLYSLPRYTWADWQPENGITVNLIRITSINSLSSDNGPHIGYSRVEEIHGDSTSTIYEYRDLVNNPDEKYAWSIMDTLSPTPFDHFSSREYKRGQLLKETLKDRNENIIRSIEYTYRSDDVESNYVLTSTINYNTPNIVNQNTPGYGYNIGVIYKLFYPKYDVVKVRTTTYENNGMVEDSVVYAKQDYTLNASYRGKYYPGIVRKTLSETQYRKEKSVKKAYKYPFTLESDSIVHKRMINKFFLPAISQENYHNGNLVKTDRTKYASWYGKEIPYLSLETWSGQIPDTLTRYQEYTDDGHLEYYKEAGKSRTRLFWDEDRLIAKITGPNLEEIEFDSSRNNPKEMFIIDNKSVFETPLMEAYVYTYDNLGNLISTTQPNGYTTYYEYDNMQRLTMIKDAHNYVIQDFEYHYR